MDGMLGKKIGMTQIFTEDGRLIPVTVIESGPCSVLQVKTKQTDGYNAVQLGFEDIKESRVNKPQLEKFKKIKVAAKRLIQEITVREPEKYQVGQNIKVSEFNLGEYVDVIGTSIGRGFQGGVKRWHWRGGPETHGSMSHRAPGSIGASSFPSKVERGHHFPGHMGHQRVTIQNLEIIKIDEGNNLLVLKGSVPGPKNGYLIIRKCIKNKVKKVPVKKEPPKDAKAQETKKAKPAAKPAKPAAAKAAKK